MGEIVQTFKKDSGELFANKPEYASLIAKKLDEAMKLDLPLQEKATAVMSSLYDLRIGTMLNATWRKTLKMTYSPDSTIKARQITSERRHSTETTKDTGGTKASPVVNPDVKLYWKTETGKIHNSVCRYFKSGKGVLTAKPTGDNCKICGGTVK